MNRPMLFLALLVLLPLKLSAADIKSLAGWGPVDRNYVVQMLFPEGRSKALVLSYDDGNVEDRQLVGLIR
jgi:hypothetical protein